MANNCKMCGTANIDGVQFCSACGSPMQGDMGQVKRDAPQSGGVSSKTMMLGMTAPKIPQDAQQPPTDIGNKTMLGVPAPHTQEQPVTPAAKPAPVAKPAPMAKPIPSTPPPAADTDPLKAKRTMLGIPAMNEDDIAKNVAALAAQSATGVAPQSDAPPASAPTSAPATSQPAAPQPAAKNMNTVPLEPTPKSDPPPAASQPSPPSSGNYSDNWDDDDQPSQTGVSRGLIIAAGTAGLVILAGVGLLLYMLIFQNSSGLKPQIFPTPNGQGITVVLGFPEAPPGSTVQVQNQTVQVLGGQVRFDLPASQMQLGENMIQLVYNKVGSAPKTLSFPIVLRHTTTTDMTGLSTAQPFFVVNFQVAQGIKLAVNGKPIQLVNGAYAHMVSLATASAAAAETGDSSIYKIPFQLTDAKGATEQGQHIVTIPITSLQVDRPADTVVVDTEEIICAGKTEEGAAVTVNGSAVGVSATGFNVSVPLKEIGEHNITIVARAPAKAPRTHILKVTRIADLKVAVNAWAKDIDEKLDYPKLARDVNTQIGKKIKVNGRIVNISTQRGVTAFLMYVGEGCPAGAKCAIYVAFKGETDAGLQSMVNVYGTVRGTRDVELRGGNTETMPALDASFVIKSDGAKKKRGKRRGRR